MRKQGIGYIRVSTLKQKELSASLDAQRSAIEAYAKKGEIQIIEWIEEAETAAKRGRPGFSRLLSMVRKNSRLCVVLHKVDRGARNLKDWADLGELADKGIEIHFAHDGRQMNSRNDRLAADVQAIVAADYIRNLRDEVRKGIDARLKAGYFPNMAPLGYLDMGKGKLKAIDPVRGPLVRKAFELYAAGGFNLDQLAHHLYALGLRKKKGGRLGASALSLILNNPFYFGRIFIRRTGASYAGIHEPLISIRLFETVQDRLLGKKKNSGLRRTYRYQKLLRCGACQNRLVAELQKGKYVYYRCHTRACPSKCVREELVDQQLLDVLTGIQVSAQDIADLGTVLGRMREREQQIREGEEKAIRLAIGKLNERLVRLTDLLLDDQIDREAHDAKRSQLIDEKVVLQERLTFVENGENPYAAAVRILELAKRLNAKDFAQTPDQVLAFARTVISNFWMRDKNIEVAWVSPLSGHVSPPLIHSGAPYRVTYRNLDLRPVIQRLEDDILGNVPTSPCHCEEEVSGVGCPHATDTKRKRERDVTGRD